MTIFLRIATARKFGYRCEDLPPERTRARSRSKIASLLGIGKRGEDFVDVGGDAGVDGASTGVSCS